MREELKKLTDTSIEAAVKAVTLCIQSKKTVLSGMWSWELNSFAIYASDVMSFPDEFEGTKGLIHPDDIAHVKTALSLMEERALNALDFRIITTYGEIKSISGKRVSIDQKKELIEPVPGSEPWLQLLEQIAKEQHYDFLELRKELAEHTERMHGIGSWMINKVTAQAWYSDNVFRIYGLAPQSLNAHANTFNHFIYTEDRVPVLDAFEKAYEEICPLHIEYRVSLPNGNIRYVQQITKWFFNYKGEQIFSGVLRDVTDERKLLNEISAAHSKTSFHHEILKLFQQQTATGYWYINLVTKQASYSENYYRIYGFKQFNHPVPDSFLHLVHADDRQRVEAALNKMYEEKEMPVMEFRIVCGDGKLRYLKQTAKFFTSANKEQLMIGIVQDVTIQKGLEKKVQELNESVTLNKWLNKLKEETAQISTITWFANGTMEWSEGFYAFLGLRRGTEASSKNLYKLIHPDDAKTFQEAQTLAWKSQDSGTIILKFISKEGIRYADVSFRVLDDDVNALVAVLHDVTAQVFLQKEYVHNKLFADLIMDVVDNVLIFTNKDNIITGWNKRAEEKTGIAKEQALQHNLFDVLPSLQNEEFLFLLKQAHQGQMTEMMRTADGYFKKIHDYQLYPLKNGADRIGVLHNVCDVSKQLELNRQLSERLNFIESLVESSVDRIVVLDRFMNYLYWNKKAEEYYGIPKEKIIGKNILEIFPSFRNDAGYVEFRKVLKGQTVHLLPVADEATREYFETYLISVKNDSGEVTAVLWIDHDLSEQKRAQEEIKAKHELLQATMDSSQDMIQVFEAVRNNQGEIVDFKWILNNHTAEKIYGDVIGKSLLQQNPGVVETGLFEKFIEVTETGITIDHEQYYSHEQFNDQWFHQTLVKMGDGFVMNTEDITERKKAEAEILRLKDEVAQKATDKYYTIFNSIDQGFLIHEMVRDDTGKAIDFRLMEVNPAFTRQTGLGSEMVGKLNSEFAPNTEDVWTETFDRVARTGIPERIESYHQPTKRWYSVHVSKVVGEERRIAAVFEDVTERKQTELRQAFLLRFSDTLRMQQDPQEIANLAIEMVFEELQVDRCYISEVFEKKGYSTVGPECLRPGMSPMSGVFQLADYPETMREMATQPLVISDADDDPRFSDLQKEMLALVPQRALLVAPLRKGEEEVIWAMCVAMSTPRKWTDNERLLLEEVAERTWAAIERAKAEEVLRGNEQKLKNFNTNLEQQIEERTKELHKQLTLLSYTEYLAQTGSWELDIVSGEFNWSEGMYVIFGLPQQTKVQPEIYMNFAVEEDRSIAKKIVNSLKKKHNPFDEIIRIKRNNEVRILKVKSSAINDENGKVQKIIGVDVDVTDVKQAEEKLKQSQHWLEQTAKTSPDSITIYDLQKKQPIYLNTCFADWLGSSNNDLLSMGINGRLNLIHPDDRLRLLHNNEKTAAAKDGELLSMEYRVRTKEGKTIWLRNRSKPFLRNASGKVTHILSILQNVTEEVELREELKRRIQFAETILDSSTNRITVFDRNYRFIAWNRRCEEIHALPKEKIIGKTIFEVFPGIENNSVFMDAQERSLKGEYVHVSQVQDGFTGTYLELFYVPLKNEANEIYAVLNIMHDVSRYVYNAGVLDALNKQLESKNAELEQKNEEITSFAFVASHDMREPLRKIHTFSDWLIEQEFQNLSEKGRMMIEKINASVHRMELLIEDILVLTKIHSDPHKAEDVDLNKILKQVFDDMFDQILTTQTEIETERLPIVKGNANQIYYLFQNLISNAIKFQKPGNVPQIKITGEIVSAKEAGIPNAAEEYAKISFADNGFGFDQRYARKIFQVFQRLHGRHEFEGTGIGLAICKKIMENHEGLITVKSEMEKGSEFSCYFPLH